MENQISIEEKRTAVIEYCHVVCPQMYRDVHVPVVNIGIERKEAALWFWVNNNNGERAGGLMGVVNLSFWDALDCPFIERIYRLLGLEAKAKDAEIQRLSGELEEAKRIKLEGMQHPAWHMFGEFTKFMEEALAADCPMVTDWRVKIHETGEDVVVLNIWAATTHESPITRCRELRANIDAKDTEIARLRAEIEELRQNGGCEIIGPHTLNAGPFEITEGGTTND